MHREIISVGQGMVADHINRNRLDNRKANLRSATIAQNLYNWAYAGHRFKGLSWSTQRRKWRVQASFNGRRINVGFFADKIQAAKAYDAAVKKYHGEFAVFNLSK